MATTKLAMKSWLYSSDHFGAYHHQGLLNVPLGDEIFPFLLGDVKK